MGMSASQARLLTITARMHDIEYQAQSIQEAKVQLATQQDEVYREYLAALDATTLTIKDWNGDLKEATFNNICGPHAIEIAGGNQYAFRDSKGALIVSDEIKNKYEAFKSDGGADPYLFAFYALGFDVQDSEFLTKLHEAEETIAEKYLTNDYKEEIQSLLNSAYEYVVKATNGAVKTDVNAAAYTVDQLQLFSGGDLQTVFNGWMTDFGLANDSELQKYASRVTDVHDKAMHSLYRSHAEEIWEAAGFEGDFDESLFEYYVRMYKEIEASGGFCTSIDDYDGAMTEYTDIGTRAANDSEWLQNMIKCGKITVDLVKTDNKTGRVSFSSTGVPSDSILEYTTTTTIDKSAMAKAEAEYEHKNRQINQKDKRFDMDLSKLETERSALSKQYDSLQKVIDDNIERTFGIFS